ncbi:hypothetical protein L208DRAFT_1345743, partial [Tricholoma matsutake]
ILGTGKGVFRVFSLDFPLLGAPLIPVLCSIILTLDFPLLEAEVALIATHSDGMSYLTTIPGEIPVSFHFFVAGKCLTLERIPAQQFMYLKQAISITGLGMPTFANALDVA